MRMANLARQHSVMSGVLDVNGSRVVYHTINAPDSLGGEMVLEDDVLYVDCAIIDIGMPFPKQQEAERQMVAFVSQWTKTKQEV